MTELNIYEQLDEVFTFENNEKLYQLHVYHTFKDPYFYMKEICDILEVNDDIEKNDVFICKDDLYHFISSINFNENKHIYPFKKFIYGQVMPQVRRRCDYSL